MAMTMKAKRMTVAEWVSIEPIYRWILLGGGVRPESPKARGFLNMKRKRTVSGR